MCGIAAILTTRDDLELTPALTRMLRALRHRGPDDEGRQELALPGGYRLGLAHTRLAILDPSPAGHQPMGDPASGSCLVYNGEVYNHAAVRNRLTGRAFHSGSDTETLLKGWVERGERLLPLLRGMFAFALYDGRRRQLWLVRDRLGVKPLYATRVGTDTWLFASEVRALLATGLVARRLHAAAVDSYLAFGAVTAPWTLLDGVVSLLPGEAWRFDLDRPARALVPARDRYWQPPFGAPAAVRTRAEAVELLRPVLSEAVGLRMVADVPVGVFLSGGLDSGGVVSVLAEQGHALRTFSVAFGERSYDESAVARQVARRFGTDHTELLLRPADVLADFDRALGAYDQPSVDGLNTYFLSQTVRQAGVKVALSGLGSDELFAGYPYFRLRARLARGLPRLLARLAHGALRRLRPHGTRTWKLGALLRSNELPLAGYAVCRQVLAPARRGVLLPGAAPADLAPLPPEVRAELEAAAGLDPINAHSRLELSLYLANMLLRDLDQMSMAHALEVREPLLDHVLVETVARLPGAFKLAPGRRSRTKGLFADALPGPLPEPVVRRRKTGFVFPWDRWLRHELRERAAAVLTDLAALQAAGLDPAAVAAAWSDFRAGGPGVRASDILCLVHLLHWVRKHGLGRADPLRRSSTPRPVFTSNLPV